MTRDDRKYVRVFYDLPRDYPAIYANDAALAAWLRLLMLAEAIWPVRGTLPRGIKPAGLRALTAVGLVELLPGHQFLIKGQDCERNARRTAASNAAAQRWHREGNAETMPSRAEQSNTDA